MGKRGKKEGHHWGTQTPQTKVCAFKRKKREDREKTMGGGSLEAKTHFKSTHFNILKPSNF